MHEIPRKTFAPQTAAEYDMLQLWVSNGIGSDALGVRCQTRWTVESSMLNVQTEHGLWLAVKHQDMDNFEDGAFEEVDLLGNGGIQHIGLAVKYLSDNDAYVVTPVGYHRLLHETHTWRFPRTVIAPGSHILDVNFRAQKGRKATLRLKVTNPGIGGRLSGELLIGQFAG